MDFDSLNAIAIAAHFRSLPALLFGLIGIGVAAFLRLGKGKSPVYLLFFAIFSIYLFEVLDYTLFQFQSLILLKQLNPNLMLRGVEGGRTWNLVPLIALTPRD